MITLSVPIILASKSPRRAHLLQQIGLQFTIDASSAVEIFEDHLSPSEIVQHLSFIKANDIAKKYKKGIIIGSDTIVVIDGEILGKPVDNNDAEKMLQRLSGRTHSVFTGIAFIDAYTKKSFVDFERTDVTFRTLRTEEIRSYIRSGSPMDKAGAYGIQDDFGAVFIERINGDYYTVVGFPISKFYLTLTNFANELGYLKGEL